MCKLSTYLIVPYFVTYMSICLNLLLIECVTKMKPGSNSVEDHPQLSRNRHPVDGALVGASSLWPIKSTRQMRTQVDTTQRKKKTNNQPKSSEDPMQRGLVAMK
jgi:hypothetical protein